MRKIILTIAIVLGISQFAKAQIDVGAGIALWGDMGIEVKANIPVTEQISISPSIDYFFEDYPGASITSLIFNVDGHYNFEVGEGFVAYPILGINYWNYSINFDDSEVDDLIGGTSGGDVGLNAGGGATYALSDSMKLYAEVKFMRSTAGLSAGILFGL